VTGSSFSPHARGFPASDLSAYPDMSLPQASTLLLAVSSCREELAFLTETFRDTTWRLREAPTYRDALTILCLDRMPVVICRCCLPDGNWKDVLSQIAVLPDAPRLIVTSHEPDDRLWTDVITLGGYDVLATPLDPKEVIWAVGRAWQSWENECCRVYQRWREAKVFAKGA
jgi:DNA-binding NtrC family response regulator